MAPVLALLLVVPMLAVQPSAAASLTFHVTSTVDALDAQVGDGACATAAGECTLRAAVQEANATTTPDTVVVAGGEYRLTLAPAGSNLDDSGDLDVLAPLTLTGSGSVATVIRGGPRPESAPPEQSGMDRLIELHETAGTVSIAGVTLTEGWSAEEGGALRSVAVGPLRLTDVTVTDSSSESEGGGIYYAMGALTLTRSTVSGNSARGGGGLYGGGEPTPSGQGARLTVTDSSMTGNTATSHGGGVAAEGATTVTISGTTIADNFAESHGGGFAVSGRSSLSLTGGVVEANRTPGDGGGGAVASEGSTTVRGTTFRQNLAGLPVGVEITDGSGAGLTTSGTGAVTIEDALFEGNDATAEGGGMYLGSAGAVLVQDTEVRANRAGAGAGIENAGMSVTLTRLHIHDNHAELDGGGIESQGSG
ncbi:MAG: right-handed parallel beta-helix repeat-containing protein, partial [Dermatophilaceae bacterium]